MLEEKGQAKRVKGKTQIAAFKASSQEKTVDRNIKRNPMFTINI